MRDTLSPLHGADLSSAVFLHQCAGGALEALCPRAGVRRLSLPLQIGLAATQALASISGQRN